MWSFRRFIFCFDERSCTSKSYKKYEYNYLRLSFLHLALVLSPKKHMCRWRRKGRVKVFTKDHPRVRPATSRKAQELWNDDWLNVMWIEQLEGWSFMCTGCARMTANYRQLLDAHLQENKCQWCSCDCQASYCPRISLNRRTMNCWNDELYKTKVSCAQKIFVLFSHRDVEDRMKMQLP